MNTDVILTGLSERGIGIGLKIAGALALWIIGRWVISGILRLVSRLLTARHIDPTLSRYTVSVLRVIATLILIIAVLGVFGVETTSFAALLAAAGVAIGMAWSGLLANFAAGVFLLILKPFRVGDLIAGGGVTGTVQELGLFATTIETVDGIVTFVGNGKLLGDNIQNLSHSNTRRVDLTAQIAHGVDVQDAKRRLASVLESMPHVLPTPAPSVEILSFTPSGTLLSVRPYTDNAHYWDVYFATNRAIAQTFDTAGYPVPETRSRVITVSAAS